MEILLRKKSLNLKAYEILDQRMSLLPNDKKKLLYHQSGDEGEWAFDSMTDPFSESSVVLKGLHVHQKEMDFQVDSLFIANNRCHLYEIKNYAGTYFFKENSIYSQSGFRIRNPLNQADRSEEYLHNIFWRNSLRVPIEKFVVFINPTFQLNSLPPTSRFLFPNQLAYHFKTYFPPHYEISKRDQKIGKVLLDLHDEYYPARNLPDYTFAQLEKGIMCPACFSKQHSNTRQNRTCTHCGHTETIMCAIKRSIEEILLLFPHIKLTTRLVYEYCGSVYSKERIRLVLKRFFQKHSIGYGRYYTRR